MRIITKVTLASIAIVGSITSYLWFQDLGLNTKGAVLMPVPYITIADR